MHQLNQEEKEQAARQGITVMQVTGKLPCELMMEHSAMLGYLRESAKREPAIADFLERHVKNAT